MDDLFTPQDWLNRAKSNLIIGKAYNALEDIYLEDLCFELQQCVEKSIKALLIYCQIEFPKIHDLGKLLNLIRKNTTIEIPNSIKHSSELTKYATKTRYPTWNKLSLEEYNEAVKIAEETYNWVKDIIEKGK